MTYRLVYPKRGLIGSLPTAKVSQTFKRVAKFRTLKATAYRVPLMFKQPIELLIRVSSSIGERNHWLMAGCLAQIIHGVPGAPKKNVQRIYLDERFFWIDGGNHSFYFEFWPYRWISDYRLEVWVRGAGNL